MAEQTRERLLPVVLAIALSCAVILTAGYLIGGLF
jgi:hypothetical protein